MTMLELDEDGNENDGGFDNLDYALTSRITTNEGRSIYDKDFGVGLVGVIGTLLPGAYAIIRERLSRSLANLPAYQTLGVEARHIARRLDVLVRIRKA